ncbi:MAG TPA: hypothetical protein VGA37_01970 [Gemmatimonadales bacterium]
MVRTTDERAGTAEPDALRDDPLAGGAAEEDGTATSAQQHLHELWQVLGLDDEDDEENEEE